MLGILKENDTNVLFCHSEIYLSGRFGLYNYNMKLLIRGDYLKRTILIGNALALGAAFFTVLASAVKTRKLIFRIQFIEELFLVTASFFFCSYSGVVVFGMGAWRSLLASFEKFTFKMSIIFVMVICSLGLLLNNRGWVGVLPVALAVAYVLQSALVREVKLLKLCMIINMIGFATYDWMISDYVSFVVDVVSIAVIIYSMRKLLKQSHRLSEKL